MDSIAEYASLLTNRENLYRLLGRLYRAEPTRELLDQLAAMGFPNECGEVELADGYRMLAGYLRQPSLDRLTDLQVDYARVFLGAGIYEGRCAAPYESVYTSKERLIMQEARDQVVEAYRAKNLDRADAVDVPEDHIALELEFLAHLCRAAQEALSSPDWPAVVNSLQEQKSFLEQHLLPWVPEFCGDVESCATTDFYRALAKITKSYLLLDQAILENLIAEAAGQAA